MKEALGRAGVTLVEALIMIEDHLVEILMVIRVEVIMKIPTEGQDIVEEALEGVVMEIGEVKKMVTEGEEAIEAEVMEETTDSIINQETVVGIIAVDTVKEKMTMVLTMERIVIQDGITTKETLILSGIIVAKMVTGIVKGIMKVAGTIVVVITIGETKERALTHGLILIIMVMMSPNKQMEIISLLGVIIARDLITIKSNKSSNNEGNSSNSWGGKQFSKPWNNNEEKRGYNNSNK